MRPPLSKLYWFAWSAAGVLAVSNLAWDHLDPRSGRSSARAESPASPGDSAVSSNALNSAGALENIYINVSDQLMPTVANISSTRHTRPVFRGRGQLFPGWPGFDLPGMGPGFGASPGFGDSDGLDSDPDGTQPQQPFSLGTGFVIESTDDRAVLLTNRHVIAGADEIQVKFSEAKGDPGLKATVIGQDEELDVALLEVHPSTRIKSAPLGDSDRLKVGEWIAALGNPFGHGHSMSHGIVSAKARALPGAYGQFLQVDAPINPGNSGGPLVNLRGEVVGINNAIDARGTGIGFAIPINAVKALLPELRLAKGPGKSIPRGFIGLQLMPDAATGLPVVARVLPGQAAARAGVQPYDIVKQVNGRDVQSTEEFTHLVRRTAPGSSLRLQILRGGKPTELTLKPTELAARGSG